MKKSILGMMALVALAANAQSVNVSPKGAERVNLKNHVAKSSAVAAESRWLNWADANVQYNFGSWADVGADDFNGWRYTIMPDSLMVQTFSDGDGHVNFHAAGVVIDPSAPEYDYLDGVNNPMTLDSVSVDMIYTRNTDASIVDTMVITILNSISDNTDWIDGDGNPSFSSAEIPYNPNADMAILGTTNSALIHDVIKVPLNVADTALTSVDVAVNKTYAAGQNMGVLVSFKPGFTYELGDNIDTKNELSLLAFEEVAGQGPTYTHSSKNMSYHITKSTRYQTNGGNIFDQIYVPTGVWTAPFVLEHNRIWLKVSSPNVGLEDFEAIGVSVYPNPTNGVVNINSESQNNDVRVFNMLGKEVLSIVKSGNFQIDLSEEKAGIYFVTVKNELGTATSKIVRN